MIAKNVCDLQSEEKLKQKQVYKERGKSHTLYHENIRALALFLSSLDYEVFFISVILQVVCNEIIETLQIVECKSVRKRRLR